MMNPTWPESALLAALIVLSLILTWSRFRPIVIVLRQARQEPGYRFRPLADRFRDAVIEVLLQKKVITERPLAGLAHALVFWGFCAFALATVDHVSRGFGVEIIARESSFGRFYSLLVAVFALAVAVAIAGLAARRFVVRPKWLGEVAAESGLIALLIFILMVSYLADYLLEPQGHIGRTIWWVHTAALLVFLPLIPGSKHLHLLFGPVAVLLKRPVFGKVPPLEGDEDFGLITGADVTKLTAFQAYACVECGRCMQHCPANITGKELNPKEIILGLRAHLNQFGCSQEPELLGNHLTQKAAFQCTTCGACEHQCPVGIQHVPLIVGLRRGAVNTGNWEDTHGGQLFLNLERNGNPFGFPASERDKFIEKAGLPYFDGTQEYCLWLGCMGSYDPQGRQTVEALAKLLRHAGVTFGVLKREKCTGDSARRLGNDLAFGQLAEENLRILGESGAKRILSICPHCVRTMSEDWKEYGAELEVEHHSEVLARHSRQLPRSAENAIVYHDPCYLGRYRQKYNEPRAVVELAGTLREAGRERERSFCCGAGGGLMFLGEEEGTRVSNTRAEELAATGAEVIATACPFCQTMFREALGEEATRAPRVADIAQLAAGSLLTGDSGDVV